MHERLLELLGRLYRKQKLHAGYVKRPWGAPGERARLGGQAGGCLKKGLVGWLGDWCQCDWLAGGIDGWDVG